MRTVLLWILLCGREGTYSETANSVRISHPAVELRDLLFLKARPFPEGVSNNGSWFQIFKWDRTHGKEFPQNSCHFNTLCKMHEHFWIRVISRMFQSMATSPKWL